MLVVAGTLYIRLEHGHTKLKLNEGWFVVVFSLLLLQPSMSRLLRDKLLADISPVDWNYVGWYWLRGGVEELCWTVVQTYPLRPQQLRGTLNTSWWAASGQFRPAVLPWAAAAAAAAGRQRRRWKRSTAFWTLWQCTPRPPPRPGTSLIPAAKSDESLHVIGIHEWTMLLPMRRRRRWMRKSEQMRNVGGSGGGGDWSRRHLHFRPVKLAQK